MTVDDKETFNHHEWSKALDNVEEQATFPTRLFKRYTLEISATVTEVIEFKDHIRMFIEIINNQYETQIRQIETDKTKTDLLNAQIKELQIRVNNIDFYEEETTIGST